MPSPLSHAQSAVATQLLPAFEEVPSMDMAFNRFVVLAG